MELKRLGPTTFWIKGKKEAALIDPTDEIWKNKNESQTRIGLFTETKIGFMGLKYGEKVVIQGPGEYEAGGIEVRGVNGGAGKVVYVMTVDGVRVVYLPVLSEALTDKRIARVEEADVLMVMADEKQPMNAKELIKLAKKWGVNYLVLVNNGSDRWLKQVLDETDREDLIVAPSIKVDKDNLPDGMEVLKL